MSETPSVTVACRVNGAPAELHGHPMDRLLDVLRREFRLTGTANYALQAPRKGVERASAAPVR